MVAGLTLPEHVDDLITLAQEHDVRLLIVDPWTNHVGDIDVNKGPELRAALMALAVAAERGNFVALLTAHPNKNSENPDPLERVAHSQAITQVARSAFWIVRDPQEGAEDTARIVAHVKHNLTPRAESIAFNIETVKLEAPDDNVPLLVETGESPHDWLALHKLNAAEAQREDQDRQTRHRASDHRVSEHGDRHDRDAKRRARCRDRTTRRQRQHGRPRSQSA